MSMSFFMGLSFLGTFLAYLFITVVLPAIAFGSRFRNLGHNEKFMAYYTIGNFFMMNIVFALELIKISNRFTLILSTVLATVLAYCHNNHISIRKWILDRWKGFDALLSGKKGLRSTLSRTGHRCREFAMKALLAIRETLENHLVDIALLTAFSIAFLRIWGTDVVTNFGYGASDMPVHNYWINYLSRKEVFVAGIYPFGFHCVIYYIHEVFGMDTYVVLRVFGLVQNFFVNMVMLSLLKYCCKTKYMPYLAIFLYGVADLFANCTYSRFYATLPQEFGMIFIYPAVYFAFAFFKERERECRLETDLYGPRKERKRKRKEEKREYKIKKRKLKEYLKTAAVKQKELYVAPDVVTRTRRLAELKRRYKPEKGRYKLRLRECFSTWYLAGFAMNFSMTFAVHFYGTMILALYAVGIALGYLVRFLKGEYFWRVVGTCFVGLFVALLPMAVAFAQGTPLQGSIGWGMSVLNGGSKDQIETEIRYVTGGAVDVSGSALQEERSGEAVSTDSKTGSPRTEAALSTEAGAGSKETKAPSATEAGAGSKETKAPSATEAGAGSKETKAPSATEAGAGSKETKAPSATDAGAASPRTGAATTVSGAAVSGGTVTDAAFVVSGGTIYYIVEEAKKMIMDKTAYQPNGNCVQSGVIQLRSPGVQTLYQKEKLQYKRSISFYLKLMLHAPHKFVEKMKYAFDIFKRTAVDYAQGFVFRSLGEKEILAFYVVLLLCLATGPILALCRQSDYGFMITSVGASVGILALLLMAKSIGLPTLMDAARCSIYFAYGVPVVLVLTCDALVYALSGFVRRKWLREIRHVVALILLLAISGHMVEGGTIKEVKYTSGLQCNEAYTCLTNIIREEEDFKWTICSANDEMRMGEDHGYHYETIDFLRSMEGAGGKAMITIPTETVYFFIEKKPIDWGSTYEGSGQRISKKAAMKELPFGGGIGVYQEESRWIVMSRMYYWAQEFQRLYPNELKVYMETDDFVCYKIKQNTYRLYNFAIDYGYNTRLQRMYYSEEEQENGKEK